MASSGGKGTARWRAASSSSCRARPSRRHDRLGAGEREIAYDYLSEIRIGRSADERIDGRPSLMLEPRTGDTLAIASVAQSGVIAEIAERLAALQLGAEGRGGSPSCCRSGRTRRTPVRALLADGPPFDPDALGLDRHQVFLTASEAVFVFESELGADALEPLLQEPELWQRPPPGTTISPGRRGSPRTSTRGRAPSSRSTARSFRPACGTAVASGPANPHAKARTPSTSKR